MEIFPQDMLTTYSRCTYDLIFWCKSLPKLSVNVGIDSNNSLQNTFDSSFLGKIHMFNNESKDMGYSDMES